MGKVATAARIVLGAVFVVFGLNGFLHFLPMPPMKPAPGDLLGAFVRSGYMLPFVAGTQVAGGALVLTGLWVPFALVLLAPVIVHILLFHLFLDPGGIGPGLLVAACALVLGWHHRRAFRGLFA